MNNFKEKLKLYFKKRTQRISISGLTVWMDWYFILLCMIILTVIGFVIALFAYRDISNGSVFESPVPESSINLSGQKNEKIETVVEYLKQR
jgi:uncharacterized protein YpmS